jgi:hypothetical protein
MDNIQIKTGANLSRLLQSTVNIPQAFTELVKNSIQNFATFCSIELKHESFGDSCCSAIITDDGHGFDHEKDPESGMNAFDKYFVFGNSYDLTGGQGIRLGQMGIGGKLANDKLSSETNIHWSIETKNKHGRCFVVDYAPSNVEFLSEYSPSLKEISAEDCSIKTPFGTKVIIHSAKSHIESGGWDKKAIDSELSTFFGFLVPKLERDGKKFQLIVNGESLDFSYKLPGSNIPAINRKFKYDYYGEERESNVEFRLSLIYDRSSIKSHPLKNIDIISKVKICPFYLSNPDLIRDTLSWLDSKGDEALENEPKVHDIFNKLIGFISCDDLSEVLDNTGMPAKDLSHHGLRGDHPITLPFFETCYKVILEWIIEYIKLNEEEKMDILDALASEVSKMLAEYFDEDEFSDLWDDDDGIEEDESDNDELDPEKEELSGKAAFALFRKDDFNPEPEEEPEEELEDPPPPPPPNNPWRRFANKKQDKSKRIRYRIIDFGEDQKNTMSRVDDVSDFTVLINSGNPKFKNFSNERWPFLLALHISELLIREITLVKNPLARPPDLDENISQFYENQYGNLKRKSG